MWEVFQHYLQEALCWCGFHNWSDTDSFHQVCTHCGEIQEKPLE